MQSGRTTPGEDAAIALSGTDSLDDPTYADLAGALADGRTDDGLPFAVQLAGRIGTDGELLAVAARIEAALR
jgi:Asp-tRNA(Asn)/Glu-tRNA(Gln) amidotransferase A subunit family amidase